MGETSQTRHIYGLIRDGRLQDAVQALQAALQVAPGSRAALSLLAHSFYQQEEYEEAARTYESLAQRFPDVPQYRLYWAQSLCKAGLLAEASRATSGLQGFQQEVAQLQAAIKYESGDLRGCRALLEPGLAAGEHAAQRNAGCVLYKEGQYAAAAAAFAAAAAADSSSPELAYAVAACQYRLRDHAAALATLGQIVEAGARLHPELGIGTQAQGVEARSVGNRAALKHTALVEAFNLRASVELMLGNPAGAAAALGDMPPRAERELDPVSLHNRALVALAAGGAAAATGMDQLAHLLAHPPFPPELLGNLLSLCCRPLGPAAGTHLGAADCAGLAEAVLRDHAPLVAATVPAEAVLLYDTCLARARSADEAAARLDAAAAAHVDGLRRRAKAVQDARAAGDELAAAAGVEAYEAALEAYVPVLMSLAAVHWEAGGHGRAAQVLQQSAELCSDHPSWRLNLAHSLVAQDDGRAAEAAELYESIVQHFAGGPGSPGGSPGGPLGGLASDGGLLDVPPAALAGLCVCRVVLGQNEAAEELLRRLEDETAAAAAAGQPLSVHLPLTNLALGTLYCAKGNFEFGITRVMRSVEPLPGGLEPLRWRGVVLCLLCLLDQAAKCMLLPKDALAADLLAFLEAVEGAGAGMPAIGGEAAGGEGQEGEPGRPQTVAAQARSLRAVLLQLSD